MQATLGESEPVGMDEVVLDPSARHGVVAHGGHAKMQRGFEQNAPRYRGACGTASAGPGLATSTEGRRSRNCRIRRQHLREPPERIPQIALKGVPGDGFQKVPAQMQRTELRQREAGVDTFQDLPVETPLYVAVFIALVVERNRLPEVPRDLF